MRNRILSLAVCLCLLLSLLPGTALAAEGTATYVKIQFSDGNFTLLDQNTPYYKNGETAATHNANDYNAWFDAKTATLHLNGFKIEDGRIYIEDDLWIVLEGENTITNETGGLHFSGALATRGGNLTFTGNGSLTCTSYSGPGIFAQGSLDGHPPANLIFESGMVTAVCKDTTDGLCTGIECDNMTVAGGTVTARTDSGARHSTGVYLVDLDQNSGNGKLTMTSGSLTATSGDATEDSTGLRCYGMEIYGGTLAVTGGAVSYNGGYSSGITLGGGTAEIWGGSLTATGGAANGSFLKYGVFAKIHRYQCIFGGFFLIFLLHF